MNAFDPASRLTLKRMAVTLAVSAVLAVFAKQGQRMSVFAGLVGLAVFISAVLAFRARNTINAPELNYWDETLLYITVTVLAMPLADG